MSEMKIENDLVVTVNYVLLDTDGNELYSTADDGPMTYMHGRSEILPGLERALNERAAGDNFGVDLAPEDAFGPHHEERIIAVPREQLDGDPEVGSVLQAQLPDGGVAYFRVADLSEDKAMLDGNHPLAGQSVRLEVTVEEVRAATDDEVASREADGGTTTH